MIRNDIYGNLMLVGFGLLVSGLSTIAIANYGLQIGENWHHSDVLLFNIVFASMGLVGLVLGVVFAYLFKPYDKIITSRYDAIDEHSVIHSNKGLIIGVTLLVVFFGGFGFVVISMTDFDEMLTPRDQKLAAKEIWIEKIENEMSCLELKKHYENPEYNAWQATGGATRVFFEKNCHKEFGYPMESYKYCSDYRGAMAGCVERTFKRMSPNIHTYPTPKYVIEFPNDWSYLHLDTGKTYTNPNDFITEFYPEDTKKYHGVITDKIYIFGEGMLDPLVKKD